MTYWRLLLLLQLIIVQASSWTLIASLYYWQRKVTGAVIKTFLLIQLRRQLKILEDEERNLLDENDKENESHNTNTKVGDMI